MYLLCLTQQQTTSLHLIILLIVSCSYLCSNSKFRKLSGCPIHLLEALIFYKRWNFKISRQMIPFFRFWLCDWLYGQICRSSRPWPGGAYLQAPPGLQREVFSRNLFSIQGCVKIKAGQGHTNSCKALLQTDDFFHLLFSYYTWERITLPAIIHKSHSSSIPVATLPY